MINIFIVGLPYITNSITYMKTNDSDIAYLLFAGSKIAARRRQLGEKESTVAAATGVSQPMLSKIEKGSYTGLKATTLVRIVKHLQMAWEDITPPNNITRNVQVLAIYYQG